MRTTAWRGLVLSLFVTASVTACSGPLDRAPKPIQAGLGPFAKAGYACAGPSSDNSALTQWQCDRQSADGVHYFVVLDGDDSGVKQVTATVDQAHAASVKSEIALTFFDDVAGIMVGGSADGVKEWVNAHVSDGGQEHVGPILITLDPLRAVDHLVVFAAG
jgi:hypothetical protein